MYFSSEIKTRTDSLNNEEKGGRPFVYKLSINWMSTAMGSVKWIDNNKPGKNLLMRGAITCDIHAGKRMLYR